MDTERLIVLAAITVAAPSGAALLAIQVRLDGTAVAELNTRHAFGSSQDFHSKFVSGNSWITEERHFAEKPGNIRATNAHIVNAHEDLAIRGCRRTGDLNNFAMERFFELNGAHELIVLWKTFGVSNISHWFEYFQYFVQQFAIERLPDPFGPIPDVFWIGASGNRSGDVRIRNRKLKGEFCKIDSFLRAMLRGFSGGC